MKENTSSQSGATLVELVVAMLILSILAIAGAASMQLSRGMAAVQRDHRTALEVANGRLEDVREASFDAIRPTSMNYNTFYLSRTGAHWRVTSSDPDEKMLVNGRARPITTTVRYVDVDGGAASYDALRVSVRLQYHGSTSSVVVLETGKAR